MDGRRVENFTVTEDSPGSPLRFWLDPVSLQMGEMACLLRPNKGFRKNNQSPHSSSGGVRAWLQWIKLLDPEVSERSPPLKISSKPHLNAALRLSGCSLPLLIFLLISENLSKQLNVLLIGTSPDFIQAVSLMLARGWGPDSALAAQTGKKKFQGFPGPGPSFPCAPFRKPGRGAGSHGVLSELNAFWLFGFCSVGTRSSKPNHCLFGGDASLETLP